MVSNLFFYPLVLCGLVWLCPLLHWVWPRNWATIPTPSSLRCHEPTRFMGLTYKPHYDACEHTSEPRLQAPSSPLRIVRAQGRRRHVGTASHFCPNEVGAAGQGPGR